jgi:hypothetical protein
VPAIAARLRKTRLVNRSNLKVNDIVVSKVEDGHHLLIVTAKPDDLLSLMYRGDGWSIQYAVAKGARLAAGRGGDLWYTDDELRSLEYLETFRPQRGPISVH